MFVSRGAHAVKFDILFSHAVTTRCNLGFYFFTRWPRGGTHSLVVLRATKLVIQISHAPQFNGFLSEYVLHKYYMKITPDKTRYFSLIERLRGESWYFSSHAVATR